MNIDLSAIQQASLQAIQMADMYQLVNNCILMNDEYTTIKHISMGGLSQVMQPMINPTPLQPPKTVTGLIDGVGNFINTINDTAKSVLQLFQ